MGADQGRQTAFKRRKTTSLMRHTFSPCSPESGFLPFVERKQTEVETVIFVSNGNQFEVGPP